MSDSLQAVREFYDQVGWQVVGDDFYQNARYEDLRPVSKRYIHACHLRVKRHLAPSGHYLLDAGSGPIQYPEYLEYSRDYDYRVCADISISALREARKRIGVHGLFVVADIAHLPFRPESFEGVVSLHTIHHLVESDQIEAYQEIHRVLAGSRTAVVVNGWSYSNILAFFEPLVKSANWMRNQFDRLKRRSGQNSGLSAGNGRLSNRHKHQDEEGPKGTFTSKHVPEWLYQRVGVRIPLEIFVWRTVSVRFMRALIHPRLGGELILRVIFGLEERFPHFFGVHGKYPLVVIHKPMEG